MRIPQAEVDRFTAYLYLKGNKKATVTTHLAVLSVIASKTNAFSKNQIDSLMSGYLALGRKNNYLNRLVTTTRSWANCFDIPDLKDYPYFKENLSIKQTLTPTELEAFLSVPKPLNMTLARHEAWVVFWLIMATTGARGGEVVKLTASDIDLASRKMYFQETKNGTPRVVYIPDPLVSALELFLPGKTNLFPPFKRNVIRANFLSRLEKAGISYRKGLSPHSIRHTYASLIIQGGANVFDVKTLLGHKTIKTTERYYHQEVVHLAHVAGSHPYIREHSDPSVKLRYSLQTIKQLNLEKDSAFDYELVEKEGGFLLKVGIKPMKRTRVD